MPPPVLPAVTAGAVISTVFGEQTAGGLWMLNTGVIVHATVHVAVNGGVQTPFHVKVNTITCPGLASTL